MYLQVNPIAWGLYGIIVTQVGDSKEPLTLTGGGGVTTVREYVQTMLGYKPSFIGPIVGILFGFAIFFAALSVVCLRFLSFQKR